MGCAWTTQTEVGAQLCPETVLGAETLLPGNGVLCPAHRPPSQMAPCLG